MDVDHPHERVAAVGEGVLEAGRDEHERPRAGDHLLVFDPEGQLPLEDEERVVLGRVSVLRRAAATRLDLDQREVEARRVGGPSEELDVADSVTLARLDDDRLQSASGAASTLSTSSSRRPVARQIDVSEAP